MFVHLSIFSKFGNINASLAVTCNYFHIQNTASFNQGGGGGGSKWEDPLMTKWGKHRSANTHPPISNYYQVVAVTSGRITEHPPL